MATLKFYNDLQKFAKPLYAFAYNLTKNQEDAKDLYQETSFRALKNWDKFHEGSNLKAWLFTIMKNKFITNYRQKSRRHVIVDSTDNLHYINSSDKEVRNGGESNIMMEELTEMIDSLDKDLRIPFLMYYEGYKYHEIADELNIPIGTVKSRIFFSRQRLKKLLASRYGYSKNERLAVG